MRREWAEAGRIVNRSVEYGGAGRVLDAAARRLVKCNKNKGLTWDQAA